MSAFIDKFRTIREDIWVNKPQEIKNALDNMEPLDISRILEAAKELSTGV